MFVSRVQVNRLVSVYFITSMYYEELDTSIITDYQFDIMCKIILNTFDKITHQHKHLLSKQNLRCGSGLGVYKTATSQMIKSANQFYNNDDSIQKTKRILDKLISRYLKEGNHKS